MRTPLKKGMLLRIGGDEYYEIRELAGEGGGSLIYEADRLRDTGLGFQRDGLRFVLKECFPLSSEHLFVRAESGEVVPKHDSERNRAYLHTVQQMQLQEGETTAAIYGTGFRLIPILNCAAEVELSEDGGATFRTVRNTVTVMESLSAKGKTLKAHLQEQRRLSLPQAFRIVEQVLYAVREVHQAGYLHLDLQDGNIFIKGSLSDQSDFATLLDFGSARKRLDDGKCAVIEDRTLFSTEGFSAPEILLHNDGTLRLGPEADIYSIGYLLLLLLTGRRYSCHELSAFQQGRYLTKMMLRKIKCPRHLVDRLQRILARMLARDPMERYHDADALLQEVSDFIQSLMPYRSDLASVEYDAFLCYRHGPVDSMAAKKMQQLLEHFRVPKAAAGYSSKRDVKRVFLDEGELSSCADFGLPIREALKNAGWLIVICSPGTPDSPWVNLEIDTFLEYHDRSRILAVLTDGEPEESFPRQLRGSYPGADGEVLAADARGKDRSAVLNRLRKDAVYRIAAPILGTTYDTLKQRRKRYVFQRAAAVAAVCLFAAAGIMSYIIYQRQQTYIEHQTALVNESQYLAQQSESLLKSGARSEAVETALKALPNGENDSTRPLVSEAVYALTEAVYAYQQETTDQFLPAESLPANFDDDTYVCEIGPNGTELMMVDSCGQLCVYDLEHLSEKYICRPADLDAGTDEEAFVNACYLPNGQIAAFSPARAYCWDAVQNQVIWSVDYADGQTRDMEALRMCAGEAVAICEQQHYVAFCAGNDLLIADFTRGEIRQRIALPEDAFYFVAEHILEIDISEDGNQIAIALENLEATGNQNQLFFVDLLEESVFVCDSFRSAILAVKCVGNNSVIIASTEHTYHDEEGDAAIELARLQFHDGAALWNQVYHAAYDVSAVTARFWNMQELWYTDSPAVTAILGHEVLQLDAETGDILHADAYDANILTLAVEGKGNLYAVLADGSIWESDMEGEDICLGAVNAEFGNAVFCLKQDMILMFGENCSEITVLSSRVGDRNVTKLDLENVLTVAYCQGKNNQYRITVSGEGEETEYGSENQTLRIWEAQTTNLLACTDSVGIKEPVGVIEHNGRDLYFYLQQADLEQRLVGWNIQDEKQVFEYAFPADEEESVNVAEFIKIVESKMYFYCNDTVIVIDGLTGETLQYTCPGLLINCAVVSSSGRWAAVAGDLTEEDGDTYMEGICLLNFSSGECKTIEEWDLSEWIPLENSLAFSPNECWLAVPANGKLSIVNTEKGRIEQTTDIPYQSSAVCTFLSDQILVACADSGRMVTWDLSQKSVIEEDTVQYAYVEELVCETDQMFRVTVSDDDGEMCIYLYTFEEDGKMNRYQKIPQDAVSIVCKEVFSLHNSEDIGFYPLYSLDDLIAKASDMLYGTR